MSITPFTADGKIDEPALRRHLRFVADRGSGIFLGALNSGEGYFLSREEIRQVYRIGVSELRGTCPAYAAALENKSPEVIIELAKEAAGLGCAAAQLYPPNSEGALQDETGTERIFRQILEAVEHPFFLSVYQHGVGAAQRLSPTMVKRLAADYPHLIGVNAAGDPSYVGEIKKAVGDKLVRGVGMGTYVQNLAVGAIGFISVEPNLLPKSCATIAARFQAGDRAGAQTLFDKVLPLHRFYGKYGGTRDRAPKVLKAALSYMGFAVGEPRAPGRLDEAALAEMREVIDRIGLRELEDL